MSAPILAMPSRNDEESAVEATLDVFSTQFSAPDERFEIWREAICRTFVALQPEISNVSAFNAEIKTVTVGGLLLSDVTAGAQIVQRRRDDIRRSSTDMLFLIRQISGSCDIHSDGRVAQMSEGDFVLVDPHLPYDLHFGANFRQHCVQIPQWWLRQRVDEDRRLMIGHCITAQMPIARILGATVDQLVEAGECRQSQIDVSEVFVDVLLRSLEGVSRSLEMTSADERQGASRVFQYIAQNFQNEYVTPTSAADALGCSVRYVHKVCAMSGVTFNKMLVDARLSEAARLLRDGPPSSARISDIAFQSGFGDLSHFCRSFKSRYGVSATEYRN
jgi:AraC family transcriptional regulator, positive regulator of tynA and feaB